MSQREELNGSAVPTKAGADPMGSTGAGAVLPQPRGLRFYNLVGGCLGEESRLEVKQLPAAGGNPQ